VFQAAFAPLVEAIAPLLPKLTVYVCLDEDSSLGPRFEDWLAAAGTESAEVAAAVALAAFVKGRISSVKTPTTILVRTDLPRSKLGKILKADIRRELMLEPIDS
jgi:acyl-CoA synthetase (AMP-forming)/AMP-acid ligase II